MGNTPLRYYKNYKYEGSIFTLLILSLANGLKNHVCISNFPSHFIDIMATFVNLTGAAYSTGYNGKPVLPYKGESFLPVVFDNELPHQKRIF